MVKSKKSCCAHQNLSRYIVYTAQKNIHDSSWSHQLKKKLPFFGLNRRDEETNTCVFCVRAFIPLYLITIMTIILIYFFPNWKPRTLNPDAKMAAICLRTQIVIKRSFSPRVRLLYTSGTPANTLKFHEYLANVSATIIYCRYTRFSCVTGGVLLCFVVQVKVTHLKNCRKMKATLHNIRYLCTVLNKRTNRIFRPDPEARCSNQKMKPHCVLYAKQTHIFFSLFAFIFSTKCLLCIRLQWSGVTEYRYSFASIESAISCYLNGH